ncbi:MAG: hypothetical protein SVR04_14465 [Spirochaetota bacterium]|nr:hypothetical protein [Spirochaetota bacterium]
MKKIRYYFCSTIILSFLLAPVPSLYSSEQQFQYILTPQFIEIDYCIPAADCDPLFASLARGEIAEITYDFRLFHESRGILSLVGDKMLAESSVVYRIRYDELNTGYILNSGDEELFFYSFEELREKIRRARISFARPVSVETENLYTRIRATIIPRKLVAPFTLLEPFLGSRRIREEWKEYRFHEAGGGS